MKTKNFRITGLCITFLLMISFFILNANIKDKFLNQTKSNQDTNPTEDNYLVFSDYSLTEYSGIGKPQNVTEFGEGLFINDPINVSNRENGTIIVPNEWVAKKVNCSINQIYEHNNIWTNETFDEDIDLKYWSNHTVESHRDFVTSSWYYNPLGANDSITLVLQHHDSADWGGVRSYLNYSFYLAREEIPNLKWDLDFKYRFIDYGGEWLEPLGNSRFLCSIFVDGSSAEFNLGRMVNYDNNTWYDDSIDEFSPELYNLDPPGNVEILFEIDCKNAVNPNGNLTLYIDNITLKLQTIAQPTQIDLNITDCEHSISAPVIDVNYGKGEILLQNIWFGDIDGKEYKFEFESNSTGKLTIYPVFYVQAVSSSYTRIELINIEGTEFVNENSTKTIWTFHVPISIPGSYSNGYYFNVSKPINWNVTHVINPYGNDKFNDTIGVGYGNSTLKIPNSIISDGIWKIIAEAPNYVKEANIYRKEPLIWKENNTFQILDKIKVNASIDTNENPDIQFTNASLLIFCPNGSLWYQENRTVDIYGFVKFSEINLDYDNTSVGEYTVHVRWKNKDYNMTQVGLYILKFEVYSDSILKRSNFHASKNIPAFSGDIVLIKVNYSDFFTNEGIADATVNYTVDNETTIEGIMIYQGGGIYSAEIDTNYLQIGLYNVSISAKKLYYQSQNNIELFNIEIQLYTTLERYDYPTVVQMRDNATVKFRYKDSYGVGITDAIVNLNINQNYIVLIDDLGDGNYTIIFSTAGFSSLGLNEISFNFSAIGYETQINILQFEIIEQSINFSVYINSQIIQENSLIEAIFKEDINVSVRIFAQIEKVYLSGGNITWNSENFNKKIIEGGDSWFNDTIPLSSNNFSSGLNYVYINFEQENYTTRNFAFQILISEQTVNISTYINGQEITENSIKQLNFNEEINISVKVFATGERIYLSGANITFISDYYNKDLMETIFPWYNTSIIISNSYFNPGINYVYIKFQLENYTIDIFSFQFLIKAQTINLTVLINSEQISENCLLNLKLNDEFLISTRSYATAEKVYLTEGIVTFVNPNSDYEKNCSGFEPYWYNTSISCSQNTFSLGINYVYLRFQKENYSTTIFSFQINVGRRNIKVTPIGFEDPIEVDQGKEIILQLNLTEEESNTYIENANVSYFSVGFGDGNFEYIDKGIYELILSIPNNKKGNYKMTLFISKEDGIYNITEFSFIIAIIEKEQTDILIWVILTGFLIVISILGIIGLRSYVILPRKRKMEQELLARTQKFKDIMNIEAIVISHRASGMPFYIKSYYLLEKQKKELLSGFIHAITAIGTSLIEEEVRAHVEGDLIKPKSIEKLIQLDFKLFHFLICDYKDIRIVFVLRDKASKRLISQTENLLIALDLQFSTDLKNWDGNLEKFNQLVPPIIDDHFELYYKDYFLLNKPKYISKVRQETELNTMETRIFNVIKVMTQDNENFYLQDVIETVSEKDKNLVIDGLESLIEKKMIVPNL